jgi:hypothetical protein
MYKSSTHLVITYFPTYLPIYLNLLLTELVTKVKPNINPVEVHPQRSNKGHPVDGALAGAGSVCPGGSSAWLDYYEVSALCECLVLKLENLCLIFLRCSNRLLFL